LPAEQVEIPVKACLGLADEARGAGKGRWDLILAAQARDLRLAVEYRVGPVFRTLARQDRTCLAHAGKRRLKRGIARLRISDQSIELGIAERAPPAIRDRRGSGIGAAGQAKR